MEQSEIVQHRRGTSNRRTSAFTLLEVLMAVFALSIVSVGLMVILDSVQTTVRSGRKVSRITNYSAAIQRQLADDIAHMTRDGFMVIVHQYADGAAPVPLYPAEQLGPDAQLGQQRARRVDELMFFSRGSYTGFRETLSEDLVAHADEARIYYGHGTRQRSNAATYLVPTLDDLNDDATSLLGANSAGNPNRFASEWTLLRHETMLIEPAQMLTVPPQLAMSTFASFGPAQFLDSDFQVGGRPAASSIFRQLAMVTPGPPGPPLPLTLRAGDRPLFASGLVDSATTSLSEIRAIVTTVSEFPDLVPDQIALEGLLAGSAFTAADLQFQQSWMLDALPAVSTAMPLAGGRLVPSRIRYEDSPPNLPAEITTGTALGQAVGKTDQMALSASQFIPNCSEFIVEWSFGNVYPDPTTTPPQPGTPPVDTRLEGRQIWHGLTRPQVPLTPSELLIATPFSDAAAALSVPNEANTYMQIYPLANSTGNFLRDSYGEYPVSSELVHGIGDMEPGNNVNRVQLNSFFGYIDPTFAQAGAQSPSQPWAWPKQLRITIRIADPETPGREDTLQFVFDVPDRSDSPL